MHTHDPRDGEGRGREGQRGRDGQREVERGSEGQREAQADPYSSLAIQRTCLQSFRPERSYVKKTKLNQNRNILKVFNAREPPSEVPLASICMHTYVHVHPTTHEHAHICVHTQCEPSIPSQSPHQKMPSSSSCSLYTSYSLLLPWGGAAPQPS